MLFLLTLITSIPALLLFQPVLDDPIGYIAGAGSDNRIFSGAFLELLLIIANIGTAVVLFPILRRQNEILALGYVAARIVECTFIAVGILSVLTVVTLGQETSGADAGAIGYALAALKDWTFILGPGFVVGVGNGLLLGYLMYRSGLMPRPLAVLGLIGGPLVCASGVAVMFGVFDQGGTGQGIATIPEFIWELGARSLAHRSKDSSRPRSPRGTTVRSGRRRLRPRHERHPLIRPAGPARSDPKFSWQGLARMEGGGS